MNLIEGVMKELERCIVLKVQYETGLAGLTNLSMITAAIEEAQRCINEGDTIAMFIVYERLKSYE